MLCKDLAGKGTWDQNHISGQALPILEGPPKKVFMVHKKA